MMLEPKTRLSRVLLIDDSENQLQLQRIHLEEAGYTVTAVRTAQDAVEEINGGQPYDAVCIDLRLPDIDGFALLALVRRVRPEAMPVIVSADASTQSILQALEDRGARRYVPKDGNYYPTLVKKVADGLDAHQIEIRDERTKLLKFPVFAEMLRRELSRAIRGRYRIAVVYIDLNGFGDLNNTYGHHVGDIVLEQVGNTIKKTIRDYDLACRAYNGDEFLIAVPIDNDAYLRELLSRLKNGFAAIPKTLPQGPESLSASFGLYLTNLPPSKEETVNMIIESADAAMREMKRVHYGL